MKENEGFLEIDTFELLRYLLRRWWAYLLTLLLAVGVALYLCWFVFVPQYDSTTKIIILNRQNADTLTYSDLQIASQLTNDYKELIQSRDVMEAVISQCGLTGSYEGLLGRVSVENIQNTRILSITVRDPSPQKAQQLADCIREIAAVHIKDVTNVEAVNVVEVANYPTRAATPSLKKCLLTAVAIQFCALSGLLAVVFISDDTIKSAKDVEKYLGMSTLALIPYRPSLRKGSKSKGKKQRRK